jgi:tetratricopeptide (TPR) repeat protein
MTSAAASLDIEIEVGRIRELSRRGRHAEALAAAEALTVAGPEQRDVLYLIAANQRCLHRIPDALAALQRLEQQHPRFSLLYQERGHCYLSLRDAVLAIEAFQQAVQVNPALVTSWRLLERLYRMNGEPGNAETAAKQIALLEQLPSEVVRAGSLFSDGALVRAEEILRGYLQNAGPHVEALRLLARIEQQRDLLDEAERLLEIALRLSPDYRAARLDYIRVLIDRQKYSAACTEIDALQRLEPENKDYLAVRAAACAGLGDYEAAIEIYRELLAAAPRSSELHVSLGHCLQAAGQAKEAIRSYRTAAEARPSFGDAYWSLANLKTYRFSDDEIVRMRTEEAAACVQPIDRYPLCFALGKALEDRGGYAESWKFYERGNALKRAESHYRPEADEANTRRQIEVCTAEFFRARAGFGVPDNDPIFIVGLPRSGSTLIEQILASHSLVEGTQELADIQRIVLGMERYPAGLAELTAEDFHHLGERYLTDTRAYRKTRKPLFTDKMPNNFRHIGLIHLVLPNAKIIDVRREPMACCFSNLRQLFAKGQEFTYSAEDIARYYRTYLDLMRHWEMALPGRVLKVFHEDVVEDLEGNVRRILKFCGLDFEPACLMFHKTERSVRTPSSEQVRQPIFREGLFQWRNYEPWLGTVRDSLGDAFTRYRE